MNEDQIRQALARMASTSPRPPRWEEMASGARRRVSRRISPIFAFATGAVAVIAVIGIVALLRGDGATAPIAGPTSTTAAVESSTTISTPIGPITEMACGSVVAPYSTTIPTGSDLGPGGEAALAVLRDSEEGVLFTAGYDYRLWSESSSELVLLGLPGPGELTYADATFEMRDGEWATTGFGQCHWQPVTPDGYGLASWQLDGPVHEDSHQLSVLANERACASGQAPIDRDVVPVVIGDANSVTVTVLVETVTGDATCPSNPDFQLDVDLGEAIASRTLFDGSEVPPVQRGQGPIAAGCEDYEWEPPVPEDEVAVWFQCGEWDLNGPISYKPTERDLASGMSPVEAVMRHLLFGPTEEEKAIGFTSWFSDETADALLSISIDDGSVVADFADSILVNNSSTTTGSVAFNDELRTNLFSIPEVESIEFRINGSCEAWANAFESDGCWIVTRQAWEQGTAPVSPQPRG